MLNLQREVIKPSAYRVLRAFSIGQEEPIIPCLVREDFSSSFHLMGNVMVKNEAQS